MIVLDGNEMLTKESLHKEIKFKLDLPDYYGENLNALHDCLTGYIDLPEEIIWSNHKHSIDALGDYAIEVISIFSDVEDLKLKLS